MIISRESRKSRKIIHRYRSYVAVRMANASEMMRFRVISEIRVRQKSCVKREYFYNAFSLRVLYKDISCVIGSRTASCHFECSEKSRRVSYKVPARNPLLQHPQSYIELTLFC